VYKIFVFYADIIVNTDTIPARSYSSSIIKIFQVVPKKNQCGRLRFWLPQLIEDFIYLQLLKNSIPRLTQEPGHLRGIALGYGLDDRGFESR
jgi:hypothetical protein